MHTLALVAFGLCLAACGGASDRRAPPASAPSAPPAQRGVLLESLTWQQAERALGPDTVVVLPIGAGAKEHGPHLKLSNDFLMTEYLEKRVVAQADVVVAPTLDYHYYPAFLEYPGSTSLRLETARDLVVDVCRSLARFGPRRFYALNTGVSTVKALAPAAEELAKDGILLRYTKILDVLAPVEREVCHQERGTHADETETSMMLYIAPESVDMSRAVREVNVGTPGHLTRDPHGAGIYSQSGVFGDATLATRDKGRRLVEAFVAALLAEIEQTRTVPLPAP